MTLTKWGRSRGAGLVADYPCAPKLDRAGACAYDAPSIAGSRTLTIEAGFVQGDTVVLDGDRTTSRIVLIARVRHGKIVQEQTA